jgi:hypothetical protein
MSKSLQDAKTPSRHPEWSVYDKVQNTNVITGKSIFQGDVQLPNAVNFSGTLSATAGKIPLPPGAVGFLTVGINGTPFKIPVYPN